MPIDAKTEAETLMSWHRRDVLKSSLALGAAALIPKAVQGWASGELEHLIPGANHDRFIIKASFTRAVSSPRLDVANKTVEGRPTDTHGRGYAFDALGLKPATLYELRLKGSDGSDLCDPWPLSTFPAPDSEPEHVRVLLYTCAGGHPIQSQGQDSPFLSMDARRRLLARGLSFNPDAMIAIGDHVYWDQRTLLESENAQRRERVRTRYEGLGMLDRSLDAMGTVNEPRLKSVAGQQIVPLYGTTLRSTPSFFVGDDHDYFENDEATPKFVTLPPYHYQQEFAGFVQTHYFPEFLPDGERPSAMSGSLPDGLSSSFGALRWGKLFEALIFDCAGHVSLKGLTAGLIPNEVEDWIHARTADTGVRQLVHVPSHPIGWTAGKWREWYPDVAQGIGDGPATATMWAGRERFELTTDAEKFMWQPGWWRQHQRLLEGLHSQRNRSAIVLSGDLHATGHARIVASGELNLATNPVHTIITGPLGTGNGWPSRARGTPPVAATDVTLEDDAPITERNGFTLLDVTREEVRVRLFAWRRDTDRVADIDQLAPYHDFTIRR